MRFDNYFNLPGFESIDFQTSSTLGTDLSRIIANAMNDVDKIWKDSNQNGEHFRNAVANYCTKNFAQDLASVIMKDTGIDVTSIQFYGRNLQNASFGLFAIELGLDNVDTVLTLMNRESGLNTSTKADKQYLEDLNHLVDLLDFNKGNLKSNKYGKGNKHVIHVNIHFDMEFAFMSNYLFADKVDKEQAVPTADEITAIMLHEIGHMMTLVEHSFDMFATANRIRENIHIVNSEKLHNDPKSVASFIDEHKKILNKIKKVAVLLPNTQQNAKLSKNIKFISAAVDKLELMKITINDAASTQSLSSKFYTFVLAIVQNILTCFMVSLIIGLMTALINYLCASLINSFNNRSISTSGKTTDRGSGYNQLFLIERWADDYAAHQGYGPELASALNKLEYACKNYLMMFDDEKLRHSTWILSLCEIASKFLDLPSVLCAPPLLDGIYEDSVRRIERVREDTYAFFRNSTDIPPAVINAYLNKIDKLNAQIKKAEDAQFWSKGTRETLSKIWFNLTPTGIYSLLNDGNLQKDLDLLNNQVDAMRNNSLYYWSDKIKYS
mgnify:CR=1 FL=1